MDDAEDTPLVDQTAGLEHASLRRIEDLRREALAKDDPMEANVGAVNCMLMLMAHRYEQVFGHVELATLDDLEVVRPSVEQLLKIVKQIDRFSRSLRESKTATS